MRRFLIVISVCALLISCSSNEDKTIRSEIKAHSELVATTSDGFSAVTIYFDNYQVDEKGKYIFYDKNYKYVGECYPSKGFAIGRNLNKVKETKNGK